MISPSSSRRHRRNRSSCSRFGPPPCQLPCRQTTWSVKKVPCGPAPSAKGGEVSRRPLPREVAAGSLLAGMGSPLHEAGAIAPACQGVGPGLGKNPLLAPGKKKLSSSAYGILPKLYMLVVLGSSTPHRTFVWAHHHEHRGQNGLDVMHDRPSDHVVIVVIGPSVSHFGLEGRPLLGRPSRVAIWRSCPRCAWRSRPWPARGEEPRLRGSCPPGGARRRARAA